MEILDPDGVSPIELKQLAPRVADLDGKVVWFADSQGEQWHEQLRPNPIFQEWQKMLAANFKLKDQQFACTEQFMVPFRHGKARFEQMAKEADVVIIGLACCGGGTSATVHDAVEFERRGVPTVTLITDSALPFGQATARTLRMPDLKFVVVSHKLHMFALIGTRAEADATAAALYPQILACVCTKH